MEDIRGRKSKVGGEGRKVNCSRTRRRFSLPWMSGHRKPTRRDHTAGGPLEPPSHHSTGLGQLYSES